MGTSDCPMCQGWLLVHVLVTVPAAAQQLVASCTVSCHAVRVPISKSSLHTRHGPSLQLLMSIDCLQAISLRNQFDE